MYKGLIRYAFLVMTLIIRCGTASAGQSGQLAAIPDEVYYRHVFQHVGALVKHADELDQQWPGAGNSFRYFFKDKASLTLEDADALNVVALACNAEVATLNKRMSAIASSFRLTFVRDHDPSVTPPAPPPELTEIRHSRDAIVLRYRDALTARVSGTGVAHLQAYIRLRSTFIGGPVQGKDK
jgi:hypothetical protein